MPWFRYHNNGMPLVMATLKIGEATSRFAITFIVDSGSLFSIVPRSNCAGLPELDAEERALPGELKDAGGKPIRGIRLNVEILIRHGPLVLPPIEDTVYVSSGVKYALLGQREFFRQRCVSFDNQPRLGLGPRFAIYDPPPHPPVRFRS